MAERVSCTACGETVTGYALDYGRRVGVYRCGATHCKHGDSRLMAALRQLGSVPEPPVTADVAELSRRVAALERTLREHGLALPSGE